MTDKKINIEQNLNEESLVTDLNKSLDNTIKDASETINKLIENLESNIQDNESHDKTIEILKNYSKSLRESVELASSKLKNKTIEKNNSKEEE
jgi:hypothetical protein